MQAYPRDDGGVTVSLSQTECEDLVALESSLMDGKVSFRRENETFINMMDAVRELKEDS